MHARFLNYRDALHFKTRKRRIRMKTIPPEEPPTL